MKTITENNTLFAYEELSEDAKHAVRNSILDITSLKVESHLEEELQNLLNSYGFDVFGFSCIHNAIKFQEFTSGGGQLYGEIKALDAFDAITELTSRDEDLYREMEMLLTGTNGMEIEVTVSGDVYMYAEEHLDTLIHWNTESDEDALDLRERFALAVEKIEKMLKSIFAKMSKEYATIYREVIDFNYSIPALEKTLSELYEMKKYFSNTGEVVHE